MGSTHFMGQPYPVFQLAEQPLSLTHSHSLSLSLSLPPSLLSSIPFFPPPTGLSDPFVELSLLPEWLFPESAKELFKTTVQKQTVDPVFNQEFKM